MTIQIGKLLRPYIAASTPLVALSTHEDMRAIEQIAQFFFSKTEKGASKKPSDQGSLYIFDATNKVREMKATPGQEKAFVMAPPTNFGPGGVMNSVQVLETFQTKAESILVMLDQQHFVRNPGIYRAMKNAMSSLKGQHSTIILIAPHWKLPDEMLHDVVCLDWALPDREELRAIAQRVEACCVERDKRMGVQRDPMTDSECDRIVDAAAGMAFEQAENAMAVAACEKKESGIVPERVLELKKQMIRTGGESITIWEPVAQDKIGGVDYLKEYAREQILPFKDDPQFRIRGLLMAGVPGTGKSLTTKALGSVLNWPIINASIPALKGSLVGQSEQNMRRLLALAAAAAPVILSFDEIEKGIAGYQNSGQTDSGVSIGMLGELLTWMQENTKPVLVVATCNDPLKMPAELMRRFDSRWYLDLPSQKERREIAEIHLLDVKCKYNNAILDAIVELSYDFTGSEVKDLVYSLGRSTNRNPKLEDVEAAASGIKPIAKSQDEVLKRLREFAQNNLRPASIGEELKAPKGRRIGSRSSSNN